MNQKGLTKQNMLFKFGIILSVVLLVLVSSNKAMASHGQAAVSDIDHTGNGTFSGSYTHSSTDHVWFVFNGTAGSTITFSATTSYSGFFWLYQATGSTIQVGHSNGSGMSYIQSYGDFTSNTYTYTVGSSGQFALQLDSYVGGSGSYSVTISGASSSCSATACTISATPNSSVYTGGVATNLYIGYGPTADTLRTAGNAMTTWSPSTYLSCSTCTATVFTPTAAGTYTISGTNCYGTCTITICVKDIRAANSGSGVRAKVMVCHKEPVTGVKRNEAVLVRGLQHHFNNHPGDRLGDCSNGCPD